jgi:ubiquinone/menaquinone biosynthesis C-methylase UbiE
LPSESRDSRIDEPRHVLSTRRFFDREAATWANQYRSGGHMADRIARFLGVVGERCRAPARILDVGCGSGEIARAFAQQGWQVTGCDISAGMIETARQHAGAPTLEWVILEPGRGLPFPNESFDAVVSSSVLEYVSDLPSHLAEIVRVLRPGGWYFATVPDMRHPARHAEEAKRRRVSHSLWFQLLRLSPWRANYVYLRLSINRFALPGWASLMQSAGLATIAPEHCDHPLALIVAQRQPVARP